MANAHAAEDDAVFNLALDEAAVRNQAVFHQRAVAVIGGDVRAALGAHGPVLGEKLAPVLGLEHIHAGLVVAVHVRDVDGVALMHVDVDGPAGLHEPAEAVAVEAAVHRAVAALEQVEQRIP